MIQRASILPALSRHALALAVALCADATHAALPGSEPDPRPRLTMAPAPSDCPRRFSLSLGGGPGFPLGRSATRFDVGLLAAVDFRWYPDPHWTLWVQTTLSLLPLVAGLPVEPGGGSALTAFTIVLGTELRGPIIADLELAMGVGAGMGGFGLGAADDVIGWAFDLSLGARYRLDPNLAMRLDFAPIVVVPLPPDSKSGGHLAIVVRGEASF